jgi:hypothetical protein
MADANGSNTLQGLTPNPSDNRQTLQCESFQVDLLKNLHKFRNENLFTDICIYVEGVEFQCHKVILCAASSYFQAMFSCDLKESRMGKVYIENITPWTMKRLIDFIYTSKIDITDDNVIDIFNGACMFNLYDLIEKCSVYIEQNIDLNNCIDLYLFADLHSLEKLKNSTYKFIVDNFDHLYEQKTSDYVKLNELAFNSILRSDMLNVSKEVHVFDAILKWINYANDQRLSCLDGLMRLVRFNAMNKDELLSVLDQPLIKSNSDIILFVQSFVGETAMFLFKIRPSTISREYLCILDSLDFKVHFLKAIIGHGFLLVFRL